MPAKKRISVEMPAALPAPFIEGLARAADAALWEWITAHAPKSLWSLVWYRDMLTHYVRTSAGGELDPKLAREVQADLPKILATLEAHGCDLRGVVMVAPGGML